MAIYGLVLIIVVRLISMNAAGNDYRYISYQDLLSINTFSSEGISYYSQLFFDVARNQVLVGARDALFRLSLLQLNHLENATWVASDDKTVLCLAKGQSEQNCHNYIKVLLTDGKRIFTCGTNAYSPLCSWREVENISHVLEWVDGRAKCPYNPSANITSLISENGDYYVGGPTDFHGSDAAISRSINEHSTIRTNQYNGLWLNEPQFVGSFETDQFVYFLFREAAVEYINCGKIIYSRIARVCKNDAGGQVMLKDNWTTFLKARLNCSISGDYPSYFDEIQSTVYIPDKNMVYATFTTPSNGLSGSAICAFNITSINAAFSGPFKYQQHMGSSWEKHYSQNQDHFSCKTSLSHGKDVIESSKYQLMDNAVQATTLSPLHIAELERYTHITVDVLATKLHDSIDVIYVATLDGLIKKLTVLPNADKSCIVEIWQPVRHPNTPILNIQYLKETNSVYVGTATELLRIPANHCRRHTSMESCYNAMDPYCGWNEIEEACTTAPNSDPSYKDWLQSITSCPVLDARVDGGWSSWSDWSACHHRTKGETESTGECLCQIRNCNNPMPQNGGKPCVGISIAVTNCTIHGDWTPWSAWSGCSATCGVALKTRARTCSNPAPAFGGRVCVGQDRTEVLCTENPPCPVTTIPPQDGQWGDWDEWTSCSAPCGGGFRTRYRKCDQPPPKNGGQECIGCDVEYDTCNMFSCSEQRRHGLWTPWFLTNSSAGDFVERRYKYSCRAPVQDSSLIKISLYKEEERVCQDGLCSLNNVEDVAHWSSWSSWSECSASCDEGIQMRMRLCEGKGECQGISVQTRKCNIISCKSEWGCWSDWETCSVSCGIGIRKRHRICLGDGCDGKSVQEESCEGPPCASLLGWGNWTIWSLCDENNEQHRQRKCRTSNPGPQLCQGSNRETRMCISGALNDVTPMGLEVEVASMSTGTAIGFILAGIVIGLFCSGLMIYLYFRKRKPRLPSSPHYISAKQNPYITVPLQDLPHKRQSTSTSNSILNNSHNNTLKSNKCYDYDTATIKRNSHSLNNGHMKTDNYYYD